MSDVWIALGLITQRFVVAPRWGIFLPPRYELPGIHGLNFLLRSSLGGGGVASLRSDPQVRIPGWPLSAPYRFTSQADLDQMKRLPVS